MGFGSDRREFEDQVKQLSKPHPAFQGRSTEQPITTQTGSLHPVTVSSRYRYDPVSALRHTTVEIVVESAPWKPAVPATALIHVAYEEEDPRRQLRARGATWEAGLRRWRVPLSLLKELHLENRLDTPSHPS